MLLSKTAEIVTQRVTKKSIYTKIDLGAVLHYTDLDWKSDLSPMPIPQDSGIF